MSDQIVNPSALLTRRAVTRRASLVALHGAERAPSLTLSALPMSVGVAALSRAALSLPRCDAQPGNATQRVRDLGRHSGREIRVARVAADVDERHDGDRLARRGDRRGGSRLPLRAFRDDS